MMRVLTPTTIFVYSTFIFSLSLPLPQLQAEEVIIDAIVATVEGNPITLHDLEQRLPGNESFKVDEIHDNPIVEKALQQTITEHLLEAEAQNRQIGVSDNEVNAYLSEVARRNNMNLDEFSEALQSEGLSIEQYAQRIRMEILKSKFGSRFFQDEADITEEEVDAYLNNHKELIESDGKVTLSQIFLAKELHSDSEAKQLLTEINEKLNAGVSFPLMASQISESPEGRAGGSLGELTIKELSSDIQAAIKGHGPGQRTDVVSTAVGWHIFHIDKKAGSFANDIENLRSMIKNQLKEKKTMAKLEELGQELQKSYVVDRKY